MSNDSNNTELAKQWADQHPAQSQRGIDESTWNALKTSLFPGAQDDSILAATDYCRARKLDVMMKPVHIVPMYVTDKESNQKGMRDVIMPGVGLYRIQADRSNDYAGADAVEFGDMIEGNFINKSEKKVVMSYPEWAKMTIYKMMPGGERVGFSVIEYWIENYATDSGNSTAPNAMWTKRPRGQIAKCFDSETEVLTSNGFEKFDSVTGSIMQVTDHCIEPVDATPFVQDYDGEMIVADGTRLNFSVTPNHDMITSLGKIEAGDLFDIATTNSQKVSIPRTAVNCNKETPISDQILQLAGFYLADGSHTGYKQFRIAVSREYKILELREIDLHQRESIKRDAGSKSKIEGRTIETKYDKNCFTYSFDLIADIVTKEKSININALLKLSQRQARLLVDSLVYFDGSDNGSGTRRLSQTNKYVIRSFEVAAIHAGYSINSRIRKGSDYNLTISESENSPVVKNASEKSASSLVMRKNVTGKVYCVTVPSGVIVVRRNGFSMICGNCVEAQALRRGWPEIGQDATAEEMEGKSYMKDVNQTESQSSAKDSGPATTAKYFPDKVFSDRFAGWSEDIASGKIEVDKVISFAESKGYQLTKMQLDKLKSVKAVVDQ